ncbi:MAG TPA: hydantoinase B/oxoprolinase family protein [Candidatus Sulfotelmatobacter sp.]|nr:hydantoinase B/oxoprolinase family protein [Candidatus Sulfotelmatobacter sp.]
MALDPITLEVLTRALISVVREMRATVFRTAKSVAIYEAHDFSCGLFAPDSQVVAQSEDIGSHILPLPWSVRAAMAKFGGSIEPGDVILLNDPYSGGTHLNDVTIIYPVFQDGRLVFFPAVREHWADVGGMVPGSMSGKATDIYQEGIRIPPLKIMERGRLNEAALELLLANMRVPDERLGDFHAGIAACRVAESRIGEICARYGVDQLLEAVRLDLDRAEQRMRACIRGLTDGVYRFEDYLETFIGGAFEPLLLQLALTIDDDRMIADFTGTSPQVPVPVNSTLAVTAAGVFITVKSVFDPDAPLNQGSFRPIDVIAPPGTIVNVQRPAPAGSHGEIRKRVIAAMVGALSQLAPERVAGDLCRTSFHNLIGGFDKRTGREWVHYEWSAGGNGGFLEADGPSAMATIDWGDLTTVQPTEVIESRLPLIVEYSRLDPDSGGAGRSRGGLSMRRGIRVTTPDAVYSLLSDGAVVPPFGVLGGLSGAPVATWIEHPDGTRHAFDTPGKVAGHPVPEGDRLVLRSAGAGGYGDPLERAAARVADDVREGYVSPDAARELYGVVLRADGTVDDGATARTRAQIAQARFRLATVRCADGFRTGAVSRHRICRLHPADAAAAGFADEDLIELDARKAAPLRAWVARDATVAQGTLPLDAIGLDILRVAAGDPVEVRLVRRCAPGEVRRAAAE